MWDIFRKSLESNTVKLFGTGSETRDFIYVADIVNIIELIVTKGNFDAAVYNVANGIETTVATVASELLRVLKYKGQIIFSGEERPGDPIYWKGENSKLRQLGYAPSYSFNEGIIKYVEWLKEEKLV